MNRLFDKSIMLACCIAAALGLAVDACLVAAFCLGVAVASLTEIAQGERARRASEAASYVYIIAAVFIPPFVPFAPLALYDIARRVRREHVWVALGAGAIFVCALVAYAHAGALPTRALLLTAILSVAATLLSLRTAQLEREQERMRRTRDELQERALALEARNRDLADRQDYEVELATLAERARIAREIHDNVGHQLTRASLQTEALRVVHANEPGVAADFADVKRTVDEALQLVRSSVHALNDNAANLSVQLERIVEGARSDGGPQIELEVLAEHAPANVANCFTAVLREALSNTMRHACAQTVTVRCMEHPSFYQLIVTDDGAGGVQASSRGTAEGMGLGSMRERVEALGGTFTAGPRAGAGGWRVFATVPKQQGDEGR
ncbi:MAG: histidine kinase [Collinsella sp.]|nr:histidine kinase [Collinsella sp.]